MALSHYEVVERSETVLLAAMIDADTETILKFCHPDIVFTNEVGKSVWGAKNLLILKPYPYTLSYDAIEILERDIRFFGTVAIVNSHEQRSGTYLGLPFSSDYHLTRVWKFGPRWQLIAATSMMPC